MNIDDGRTSLAYAFGCIWLSVVTLHIFYALYVNDMHGQTGESVLGMATDSIAILLSLVLFIALALNRSSTRRNGYFMLLLAIVIMAMYFDCSV